MTAAPLIQRAKFCCYYKLTPCFEEGDGCAAYNAICGRTPDSFSVTFSGITLNSGSTKCDPGSPTASWHTNPGVGPNGTFVLPQFIADPCSYILDTSSSGKLQQNAVLYDVGTYQVLLTIFGTSMRVAAGYTTPFGQAGGAEVFEETVPLVCGAVNANNDLNSLACEPVALGNTWTRASDDDGSAILVPGDVTASGVRCPGGYPFIVSNPEFSSYVGRVVTVDDVCYQVTRATVAEFCAAEKIFELEEDAMATLTDCGTDCQDCCDDNCP